MTKIVTKESAGFALVSTLGAAVISTDTPVDTGTANLAGSSLSLALADHVHRDVVLQTAQGLVSADQTTSSGSLSDLVGASKTITTSSGSKVRINCSFSTSNSSILGATNTMVLDIDGVTTVGAANTSPALTSNTQAGSIVYLATGLSAGSHTFKLRWSTSAGTARCRPASAPNTEHAIINLMEVRL